jgi:hypothetical protein
LTSLPKEKIARFRIENRQFQHPKTKEFPDGNHLEYVHLKLFALHAKDYYIYHEGQEENCLNQDSQDDSILLSANDSGGLSI